MGMLSTSRARLAHVRYLTVKPWPENTIASMTESKFRTPVSSMKFAQEAVSK